MSSRCKCCDHVMQPEDLTWNVNGFWEPCLKCRAIIFNQDEEILGLTIDDDELELEIPE